jgi:hypothetical protein
MLRRFRRGMVGRLKDFEVFWFLDVYTLVGFDHAIMIRAVCGLDRRRGYLF